MIKMVSRNSKGISAVIAVIMLLMITVALAGMAYVWFTGVFSQVTTSVGNQTIQTTIALGTKFVIETAYNDSNPATQVKFVLRNTGTQNIDLSGLGVYINDVSQTLSATGTVSPGQKSSVLTISPTGFNCGKSLRVTGGVGGYEAAKTISC